jgi:phage shock protein A
MTKQTILGRVAQFARADVLGLVDQAEDPFKMLDQLIRDCAGTLREAEDAAASGLSYQRRLEEDRAEDMAAAAEWGGKARTASRRADELRDAGAVAAADRFDTLARIALGHQLRAEWDAGSAAPLVAAQAETNRLLTDGLEGVKARLAELRTRRDELVARSRTASARAPLADALREADVFDPAGELGRFDDKLRREEARAAGREELAASTLDARFETLDPEFTTPETSAEITTRLAHLKARPASA